MSSLLERVREALAPAYAVEREIASGGMGVVFYAQDPLLRRPVAIKVMRPELATAHAAARFVREAQILASLRHPNIVPVHRAGEAAGLFYYVMDFVDGKTLAESLLRGPLSRGEVVKVGRDLLDGVESAHRAGVVHRDIKPANIFMLDGRALLADFGIAKPSNALRDEDETETEGIVGTPAYMAPEQVAGDKVTVQSDLYSVGAVLFEALTGRRWKLRAKPERSDWRGAPRALARVLERALAWSPSERWPDARAFRHALWRTRTRRYVHRTVALAASGVLVGAGVTGVCFRPGPPSPLVPTVSVVVEPLELRGVTPVLGLPDTVGSWLVRNLSGYPDFAVRESSGFLPPAGTEIVLSGTLTAADGRLSVELREQHAPGGVGKVVADVAVPEASWTLLADSLAYYVLLRIWSEASPLAGELPHRALPRSPRGLATWLTAERLFARAQWGRAYAVYQEAEAVDSTCWLCSWRLGEVERWLGLEHDPRRTERYLARLDSFPPHYQTLIRSSVVSPPARFDSLRAAAARSRGFFLSWMLLGDELFHRGPLSGHLRHEAIEAFQNVTRLRPDFAPGWEHLSWILVAEGDSAGAREAMANHRKVAELQDPLGLVVAALLEIGFAWRFGAIGDAASVTEAVISDPRVGSFPDVAAGPRLLPSFDAAHGAIGLGGTFAAMANRRDLERSGLIAQFLGFLAVGQLDSARRRADRLWARFPENDDLTLTTAEIEAAYSLAAPEHGALRPAARVVLERYATRQGGAPALRLRAAWMLSLLHLASGERGRMGRFREVLREEPSPAPLRAFVDASSLASRADWRGALEASEPLVALDSAAQAGDPTFRTLLHLSRASWYEQLGRAGWENARRELRWHENLDLVGYPTGVPQAAEIDWATATIARWRRASLLARSDERGLEICAAYHGVIRHWVRADPPLAARAVAAREAAASMGCPE